MKPEDRFSNTPDQAATYERRRAESDDERWWPGPWYAPAGLDLELPRPEDA